MLNVVPRFELSPIVDRRYTLLVRAVSTTVEATARFHSMANYFTSAMVAFRRHDMDGALEAIKIVGDTGGDDFDRFVVLISTNLTFIHKSLSSVWFSLVKKTV